MTGATKGLAAVVGVVALAGLGALSQVPYPRHVPDHAVIRLTWRARSGRIEECRRRSAEELAALPAHMRQEDVCEGRVLSYHLRAMLDGEVAIDEMVAPTGARADRPLYVYYEMPVPPGTHDLAVDFLREDVADPDAGAGGEEAGETAGEVHGSQTPRALRFAERLTLDPRQVTLVTYDVDAQQLVLRGYGRMP